MKPIRKKCNLEGAAGLLYRLGFSFSLLFLLFSSSFVKKLLLDGPAYRILFLLPLFLLLLSEALRFLFLREYRLSDLLSWALILFSSYLSIRNDQRALIHGFLLIYGARKQDIRRLFRIAAILLSAGAFSIVLLSFSGIILYQIGEKDGILRHSMGFSYPLVLPAYLLTITMLSLLLLSPQEEAGGTAVPAGKAGESGPAQPLGGWGKLLLSLLLFFNLTVHRWCIGDLSRGMSLLFLLLFLYLSTGFSKKTEKLLSILDRLSLLSYPLCFLLSLAAAFFYRPGAGGWLGRLNSLLNRRIEYSQLSLFRYGFGLFSRRISWVGAGTDLNGTAVPGQYDYVDNVYLSVLQRYGLLFTLLSLFLLFLAMRYCCRRRWRLALYFFALLSFHGLLEDKIYLIEYNTLLLLIGPALSEFLEELRISAGKKRQKQGYRIRP